MDTQERDKSKLFIETAKEVFIQLSNDKKVVKLLLGPEIDDAVLWAKKDVLEMLKFQHVISKYAFKTLVVDEPDLPNPYRKASDKDAYKKYKKRLARYKKDLNEFGARYRWALITASDINLRNLRKILIKAEQITSNLFKKVNIKFIDGLIVDVENDIAINKYTPRHKTYPIAQCLFNQLGTTGEWVEWEKIAQTVREEPEFGEGIEGLSLDEKKYKRMIYDTLDDLNKHALKVLKREIIEMEGKDRYRLSFIEK